MAEHPESSGWTIFQMESLSWLNMGIGALILVGAALADLPDWTFWSAVVAGTAIVVLEIFDEWAERQDLAREVVGPESVVLVASLWLVGTVLVTGGPALFVAIAVVGGLVVAASSLMNTISAFRMDTTPGQREGD